VSYSDVELLDDIRRVAEDLRHQPSLKEYRERGNHSVTTFYNRFESWSDAVGEAGFEPRDPEAKIEREDLLAELHRLTAELGRPPKSSEMDAEGNYWTSTYRNEFGRWSRALEAAGYEARRPTQGTPVEDLLEELHRLAEKYGGRPTTRQMDESGKFAYSVYQRRFGSWSRALQAAGLDPDPPGGVSTETLRAELERLGEELGKRPTKREMSTHGEHSPNTYHARFGSWSAALEDVFDGKEIPNTATQEEARSEQQAPIQGAEMLSQP